MSKFIQVPIEIITKLTNRCKHKEAFVYAAIRSQIKDGTRTASYPMANLAKLCNVDERTIYNYIDSLMCIGLFSLLDSKKKQLKGDHRYNIYLFPYIKDNCMLINPSFIEDESFTTEEKGVMLFIKANCYNGTNHFLFKSMAELKAKIGVGKNSTVIKDLEYKGFVRIIGKAIIITNDAFPLYLNGKPENYIYHLIYNYCLYKGVVPPIKEERALFYLKTKYSDGYTRLKEDLLYKCKNLPNEISLNYFCMALLNMMPEKRSNLDLEFTM
jgi:hypothetical protein